ncbi:hypothetical protein GCM10009802_44000 [Streptomyces synnematoformans]|uniref:Uncharacterized protein n=1 Tax=Streptomyces synnematoformans TaxID=415721 RepID=A0ABP5KS46_9ACTN
MATGMSAIEPSQSYEETRDSLSSGISWCSAIIHATAKTSTHVPETNITAASPATGSGTARAAPGSASGKMHSTPASSTRRGLHLVITSAPASVPAAKAPMARPHGPAPPRCSRATSGPYTPSAAATTALTTANCSTIDQSQGRPVTSRRPSRRSARMPPPGCRSGMPLTSRNARSAAATANAPASTASTHPGPTAATMAPPSAAPPIPAPLTPTRNSANARPACAPVTDESTMPSAAGAKNACPVPPTADSSTICHTRASPVITSAAKTPCEAQLTAFATTITRCRGIRSATAPPTSTKTTSAVVRAAATSPTSVAEPPASSTANAEAISAPEAPRLVITAARDRSV